MIYTKKLSHHPFCDSLMAGTTTRRPLSSTTSSKSTSTTAPTRGERPEGIPDDVEYEDKTLPRPVLDPADYPEKVAVRMPDMGGDGGDDDGHKSKILRWYVREGDVILREDVLCDIETPDFVFGMETEDEHPAIMGEIVVPAPSEGVPDGAVICYLMHPSSSKEKAQEEKKDEEKKEE